MGPWWVFHADAGGWAANQAGTAKVRLGGGQRQHKAKRPGVAARGAENAGWVSPATLGYLCVSL
jgi:hypothetical protein